MKVVVTGGAGFIGSHTCERLLQGGHKVVCIDNFNDYYSPSTKYENVASIRENPDFQLVEGDIRDRAALSVAFANGPVDAVIHLAAMAGVRRSFEEPELYADVNVVGSLKVLEMARRHGVGRLILASSSSVYGIRSIAPFREDDPIETPASPYAATKRSMELLAYVYWQAYRMPITVLRLFTVYGPRGRPDMAPYIFSRAILQDRPIQVFGNGLAQRDYTFIDDIIDGIMAALDRKSESYAIYNLGNSHPVSLREFIATIEKVTGKRATIEYTAERLGDVPLTCADISRASRDLGYHPKVDLEEGLRRLVAWLKAKIDPS